MSINKQHIIAFHPDNQQVATEIREELAKSGYLIEAKSLSGAADTPLRQSVTSPSGAILLLVTDNFLKSEPCMNGALDALRHWADNGQLVPIVADGKQRKPDGSGWEAVPTLFERVSNIIHYMNHWQDKYLSLRKEVRGQEDNEKLESQIEVTKNIASDIGDFLRNLRNLRWHSLEDFKAGNYAAFRQFTDDVALEPVATAPQPTVPSPTQAPTDTPRQRTLAEIIQDSGDELMAENTDIGQKKKAREPEDSDAVVDINDIPGISLLKDFDASLDAADSKKKNKADEEEDLEISSVLDEVLGEEEDDEILGFVGDDPDHPDDFDLNSLFDEEEDLVESQPNLQDFHQDEVSLELISDEEEGLVLRADGNGHSTPEEVLEHAVLLFDDGKQAEGLDFLRQTVQLNASDNTMRYYFAYALARYGQDFSGAKSQLEVILANDMEHTDALFLLGELSEGLGEYEEAKHNYETVAALQPDFPEVYYKLGMLTLQHFEGEENLALEFFKKSVEFNQRNADAQYILGTLYNGVADDALSAIQHFHLALRFNPKHDLANYDLALLYFQNGEKELAAEHYSQAIALNPELQSPENDAVFLTPMKQAEPTVSDAEEVGQEIASLDLEDIMLELAAADLITDEIQETSSVDAMEAAAENMATDEEPAQELDTTTEIAEAVEDAVIKLRQEEEKEELHEMPMLEEILEEEEEEEEVAIAPEEKLLPMEGKTPTDPPGKNFITKLEQILDQEDDPEEGEFGYPLSDETAKTATKTVLITGATSGIGLATAELFAKNGYRVIATGRRSDRLEQMAKFFKDKYQNDLLTLPFDVRNLEAVKSAIDNLPTEWREVDILVNNAGLSRGLSPIHEGDIEHWETMIDTNIKGLLYLTRAVAPHMVERRSGHIINVASSAGKEVYPGGNVYCATKFAVDALTKAMRLDLFTHNIRVSQVAPGHVEETEFARVRFDWDTERAAKVYENFQPLKSSDVAEVIYFIATRPAHVNVQDILVFGTQQAGSNFIDRSGRPDEREGEA